jgi:tyrosinase
VASAASAFTPASTAKTDFLAAKGLVNLAINQIEKAFKGQSGTCTLANAHVRKEW